MSGWTGLISSPPPLTLRRIGNRPPDSPDIYRDRESSLTKKAINLAIARLRLFLRSKVQVNLAFSQRKSHQLSLMAFIVAGNWLSKKEYENGDFSGKIIRLYGDFSVDLKVYNESLDDYDDLPF